MSDLNFEQWHHVNTLPTRLRWPPGLLFYVISYYCSRKLVKKMENFGQWKSINKYHVCPEGKIKIILNIWKCAYIIFWHKLVTLTLTSNHCFTVMPRSKKSKRRSPILPNWSNNSFVGFRPAFAFASKCLSFAFTVYARLHLFIPLWKDIR